MEDILLLPTPMEALAFIVFSEPRLLSYASVCKGASRRFTFVRLILVCCRRGSDL
jgi:hypothetical protein